MKRNCLLPYLKEPLEVRKVRKVRKTRTAIQKYIQWLRKGQKTGLVKLAYLQSSRGVDVAFG